jgi:lipid-A-disaccharide synthase
VEQIRRSRSGPAPCFILAVPPGTLPPGSTFRERISRSSIQLQEGQSWDVLACADLALAASGTVTIEAALLGAPLIAFYRVTKLTWWMGRWLVNVPFFSMVNLVAGRRIVPELIQDDLTAQRLAEEALRLLGDDSARESMRRELSVVAQKLSGPENPLERAAGLVEEYLAGAGENRASFKKEMVHAS